MPWDKNKEFTQAELNALVAKEVKKAKSTWTLQQKKHKNENNKAIMMILDSDNESVNPHNKDTADLTQLQLQLNGVDLKDLAQCLENTPCLTLSEGQAMVSIYVKAECQTVSESTVHHDKSIAKIETGNNDSLDQCIDRASAKDFYSLAQLIKGHPHKKQKVTDVKPIVFARLNSCLGKPKPITLECLLDSGASGSLIAAKHATN